MGHRFWVSLQQCTKRFFWSHEMASGVGFFFGGGSGWVHQNNRCLESGLIASGERWYLKLGWHHISGTSLNVSAREAVANGKTSNRFLKQHDRTGSMYMACRQLKVLDFLSCGCARKVVVKRGSYVKGGHLGKRQEAQDTAHTTHLVPKAVNKGIDSNDTANTGHQARTPLKKRQDTEEAAHTSQQARAPMNKRQESRDTEHTTHQGATLVNKPEEAKDTAHTELQARTPI